MSKELEELQRANPDKEIIAITVYFINGVLHVTKAFIAQSMGVSERAVTTWQQQGLKRSEYSLPRFNLYDFEYVERWHKNNIDQKQSQRRKKRNL